MAAKHAPPGSDEGPDPVQQFADILEYASTIGFAATARWYDRAKKKPQWSAEDVVSDCTDLVEHFTPLIERTLNLTIEALRPYAATLGKDAK